MTKKLSKELLQKQIDKLAEPTLQRNESWIHKTSSLIKDIFGENSEEFKYITNFKFRTGLIYEGEEIMNIAMNSNKAVQFLNDCIETIDIKGIYRHPKSNFLTRLDNGTLSGVLIFVLGLIGSVCYGWGKYNSDVQNIELKQQVKSLQDSIGVLKSQPKKAKLPLLK